MACVRQTRVLKSDAWRMITARLVLLSQMVAGFVGKNHVFG